MPLSYYLPLFLLVAEGVLLRFFQHHILQWRVGWHFGFTDWDLVGLFGGVLLLVWLLYQRGELFWAPQKQRVLRRTFWLLLSLLLVFFAYALHPLFLIFAILGECISAYFLFLAFFEIRLAEEKNLYLGILGALLISASPWLGKQVGDSLWTVYAEMWVIPLSTLFSGGKMWMMLDDQQNLRTLFNGIGFFIHSGSSGLDLYFLAFGFCLLWWGKRKGASQPGDLQIPLFFLVVTFLIASAKFLLYFGFAHFLAQFIGRGESRRVLYHLFHKHALWIGHYCLLSYLLKKEGARASKYFLLHWGRT